MRMDVQMMISVRYALRALGLRTEFYKMAAEYPTTAKMKLPVLQKIRAVSDADDMEDAMEKLEVHMSTEFMKVVATLKVINTTNTLGGGRDGAADGTQCTKS